MHIIPKGRGNDPCGHQGEGTKPTVGHTRLTASTGTAARTSKMLISRIEGGDGYIHDSQIADSPMPAAGLDEYRGEWLERHDFAVKLHVALPLQHEIDLGEPFVEMRPAIGRDINHMDGGDRVVVGHERPPRLAARAGNRGDLVELGDAIAGCGWLCRCKTHRMNLLEGNMAKRMNKMADARSHFIET
jgi:hypothetical protein